MAETGWEVASVEPISDKSKKNPWTVVSTKPVRQKQSPIPPVDPWAVVSTKPVQQPKVAAPAPVQSTHGQTDPWKVVAQAPMPNAGLAPPAGSGVVPQKVGLVTGAPVPEVPNFNQVAKEKQEANRATFSQPLLPHAQEALAEHRKMAESVDATKHPVIAWLADLDVVGAQTLVGLSTPGNLALLTGMAFLPEASAAKKLVDFGFAEQQAIDAVHDFREAWRLHSEGKSREARQKFLSGGVQSLFAAVATKGGRDAGKTAETPAEAPKLAEASVTPTETATVAPAPKEAQEPAPEAAKPKESVIKRKTRKLEEEQAARAAEEKPAEITPPQGETEKATEPTVRLYRGESIPGSGKGLPEWIQNNREVDPKAKASADAEGRWFTDDIAEAQKYAEEAGTGRVTYIDVSRSEAESLRAANNPDAAKFVHSTKKGSVNDEYYVSPEHAKSARVLEEEKPVESKTPSKSDDAVQMPWNQLVVDPKRFQYKLNTNEKGTTGILEGRKWNNNLSGVVSGWVDPETGLINVVNGHHRKALADENIAAGVDVPPATVKLIHADTAEAARAIGALQNVAEGRGTAVDAAKLFRDSNMGPEDLERNGITQSEAITQKAMALKNLSDKIFTDVTTGKITENRGVAIGRATADPVQQEAILDLVEKRERTGKTVTNGTIEELGRMVLGSKKKTEKQEDLFGTHEETRSLALDKADASDYAQKQLKQEKRLFGGVSTEGTAARLGKAGNVIKAEENAKIAKEAEQAQELYNRLSVTKGPIDNILNHAAGELADGENAHAVKARAYEEIRKVLSGTIGEAEGRSVDGVQENSGQHAVVPAEEQPPVHAETEAPAEPTLPGMESVPSERADAAAEKQGEDLTQEAAQPAENVSKATGEMERESPLFRDSGASGQESMFGGDEETTFGLTVPGAAQAVQALEGLYEEDIAPWLKERGLTFSNALTQARELLAPRSGAAVETLDTLHHEFGEFEKRRFVLDKVLNDSRKMFEKLPQESNVQFFDRFKRGQEMPTEALQDIADFFKATGDDTWRRYVDASIRALNDEEISNLWGAMSEGDKEAFRDNLWRLKGDESLEEESPIFKQLVDASLNYKENHLEVQWKEKPKSLEDMEQGDLLEPDESATASAPAKSTGIGRRTLSGSRSFTKKASLPDMSSGLERGGVPYTYNPVEMFQRTQANAERAITATEMWSDALEQGARKYVVRGTDPPEGFTKIIGDRIGNVRFPAKSGEGMIEAGDWYMRNDYARLLNNYLGGDFIRESDIGKGALYLKNKLTMWRLGMSGFHAITTTVSGIGSEAGLSLRLAVYALRHGDIDAAKSSAKSALMTAYAPALRTQIGFNAWRYAIDPEGFSETPQGQEFTKAYPNIKEMIDDAFDGGAKFGLHEDEKTRDLSKFREAWADADWGNRRALGSAAKIGIRIPGAIMEKAFTLLFEYYIPLIKLGSFVREHAFNLADYSNELASGRMTRGEIARKSWDSVDDLFGQVNWDKFFWKRSLKTTMQIAFRAAQWRAGNVRLVSNAARGQQAEFLLAARAGYAAFHPEYRGLRGESAIPRLDPNFAKIVGLFAAWTVGNGMAQLMMGQGFPKSAADLFAARTGGTDAHGKPKRVTTPAVVFKDILSLKYHGLLNYMTAGESDLLGGVSDALRNRDFANNMIHNPGTKFLSPSARWQDAKHIVGAPMSVSNALQQERGGEGLKGIALGAAGFTPPPSGFDWTPAERKANEILQEKHGPMTPEEQSDMRDYMQRKESGQLTEKEKASAAKHAGEPFIVHLVNTRDKNGSFKLSIEDVLSVYEDASASEQKILKPLIERRKREISKIPEARRKDVMQDYIEAVR